MAGVILALLIYVLVFPILLRLLCVAHTKVFISRKMAKMPRNKASQGNLPKPIWPRIKERVKFAFKDDRPAQFGKKKEAKSGGLPNKRLLLMLWGSGLIIALASGLMGNWKLFALAPIAFIFAVGFALVSANPVIKGREQLYRKMFEIGKSTLGISAEYAEQPQAVIQVLDWRDILRPSKVRFEVPTTFGADSEENFLRQFNQIFGTETTWVAFNDPETGKPGWNYEDGQVTLKETPPLPQSAPWDEHYVLDPSVAWSFFPIGLGVEDGIELENPKTGEIENVLGFDLSGVQPELSKKLGKYCSPTITTSPMVLAAGGTGGGKSLAIATKVAVRRNATNDNSD